MRAGCALSKVEVEAMVNWADRKAEARETGRSMGLAAADYHDAYRGWLGAVAEESVEAEAEAACPSWCVGDVLRSYFTAGYVAGWMEFADEAEAAAEWQWEPADQDPDVVR